MDYTKEQMVDIIKEARLEAYKASDNFFKTKLGGRDQGCCGFAWVEIYGINGNTKLGRAMKSAGLEKSHTGAFRIWNPSGFGCQNINTLEEGAQAAAQVFKKYGFDKAYAGSRLD